VLDCLVWSRVDFYLLDPRFYVLHRSFDVFLHHVSFDDVKLLYGI
jgi:hypothetical protein